MQPRTKVHQQIPIAYALLPNSPQALSSSPSNPSSLQSVSVSADSPDPLDTLSKRASKRKNSNSSACLSAGAVAGGTIGGFFLGVVLGGAVAWFLGLSRGRKKGFAAGEKLVESERQVASPPVHEEVEWRRSELPSDAVYTGNMGGGFTGSASPRTVTLPGMAELGPTNPASVGITGPREIVGEEQATVVHEM
ncbi:MAG: hypothetical protein M1822_001747 [Bathelium mastoideum]|nr:MAG: hypothetical protein M1822_001747 [Bathelium mastoideum]